MWLVKPLEYTELGQNTQNGKCVKTLTHGLTLIIWALGYVFSCGARMGKKCVWLQKYKHVRWRRVMCVYSQTHVPVCSSILNSPPATEHQNTFLFILPLLLPSIFLSAFSTERSHNPFFSLLLLHTPPCFPELHLCGLIPLLRRLFLVKSVWHNA